MPETEALTKQVQQLTATVQSFQHLLARVVGSRLTRDQLAERLDVHRNTIPNWMAEDPMFPKPDRYGKWMLSEVIEWEQRPKR